MSYGYSARIIKGNKAANQKLLGVKLGAACIKHDVPVSQVSEKLGVSRQTIYNWFVGEYTPNGKLIASTTKLLRVYTSKK